jgi:tetratricopeptide (TPR) repeat protein
MKPFPVFISFGLIIFVLAAIILGAPGVLTGQETSREEKASKNKTEEVLKPIPPPPLDHLEKAVSDQLREGQRMVDAVSGNSAASRQERAQAYGQLGQLYHAYELNEAAEACYRNALILDPSYLEWTYSLGYLLQSTGKFSDALQLYQQMKAGQQNPQLAYLVYIRMGECYRRLNRLDQAKPAFEAAYQLNPEGPAVLARLGEIALDEKHYDLAIKDLTSALEKQPGANKLHYPLGMAYRGKGDMEQARFHLAKYGMVGVQPPDPVKAHLEKLVTGYWTHILAGKLAFSARRYTEAARAFQKAVETEPKKTEAKVNLAAALAKLNRQEEAITQLQEAIQLTPDDVTAHFNLGMLNISSGNYGEAIKHLQIVVKKEPKDSQVHLTLANAFRKEQQLEKAIEHYKTALSLDSSLTWGWIDLSSSYRLIGQYAEALRVLEEAHSRLPYDGPIAHALARLLATTPNLEQRQGKRALELALKVYRALEDFVHAKTVAMAYAQLDQCSKAVEWMEKAIELASKSSQDTAVLENLKNNLEYFKTHHPCRVPAQQETE